MPKPVQGIVKPSGDHFLVDYHLLTGGFKRLNGPIREHLLIGPRQGRRWSMEMHPSPGFVVTVLRGNNCKTKKMSCVRREVRVSGVSTSTTAGGHVFRPTSDKHRVLVALGSNVGDRVGLIEKACTEMNRRQLKVTAMSNLYETAPMYVTDQAAFINGVCQVSKAHLSSVLGLAG